MNQQALSSFIWSVADLLRGDYEGGKLVADDEPYRRDAQADDHNRRQGVPDRNDPILDHPGEIHGRALVGDRDVTPGPPGGARSSRPWTGSP